MSNLTAAQLYINISALSDVDPYANAALTSIAGGLKIVSGVASVSNAALYTGGVYVTAAHTASVVSAWAKIALPSDAQGVILIDPATGNGFILKGSSGFNLYALTANEIGSSPIAYGTTTLANNDEYGISYDGTTISAYKNDVVDFTYDVDADGMHVGWLYNLDNVHAGGARAIGFNYSSGTPSEDPAITELDDVLIVGNTHDLITENMGVRASVTFDGIELQFTETTVTLPEWIDGQEDPLDIGQAYDFVVTDEDDVSVTVTREYGLPVGYTYNQMGAGLTLDTGADSFGKNPDIVSGSELYVPDLNGGVVTNDGLSENVPFASYPADPETAEWNEFFWRRDLDLVMHKITVNYVNSEA